jgi:hypothetical protein
MHWRNVSADIVACQRDAFAALGYKIEQIEADRVPHGQWMNENLAGLGPDDSILFVDIDALALKADVIEEAFVAAEAGRIYGAAQSANHRDPDFIYAAPSFLCLSRRSWDAAGQPSMLPDETYDAGGRLSAAAKAKGIAVDLLWPSYCLMPKWPLSTKGCFGMGTFYDGRVFHLFESRSDTGWKFVLEQISQDVVSGKPPNYLALYARVHGVRARLTSFKGSIVRRAEKLGRSLRKRLGQK